MPLHSRKTILLATDHQRSVINALVENRRQHIAYTPYGHRPAENGLLSLLGFNGERPDPLTGHYHLGNGYRQFNPVLMRFNSPDSWSPFGEGGLNAYVYCLGDPVNATDRSGHTPYPLKLLLKKLGLMSKSSKGKNRVSVTIANQKTTTPPPLNSPKTADQLNPDDFYKDDLNLSFFTPKNQSNLPSSFKNSKISKNSVNKPIGSITDPKSQAIPPPKGKHFPPQRALPKSHRGSLPSLEEFLSTATSEQLSAGFNDVKYALEQSQTSAFIKIGIAYEQEMLNRAIRASS
ncbi:hypothetical protein EMIT0P43_50108 [Pseudomonas jessenii]|jgi:RHS repeat-associated protein|uniref:RHS repeat-associated core domain-containing protein n=1 Tax=Pseudomonas TaxID=286 RepID=UPI00125BA5A8|nr:hypothetical protein PS843_03087 [Pseudomonas fluorescens]